MSALKSSKGYSLIELMTVVVIVGLLGSFAIPKYEGYVDKARTARCIAEIYYFEKEIDVYYIANEKYPNSLDDLGRSISNITDPWGNPYQYLLIAGTKFASNGGSGGKSFAWAPPSGGDGSSGSSWFFGTAYAAAGGSVKPRKDRFLVPINSDYDLYSMGPDGKTNEPLTNPVSKDDIIRASDGAYVGVAENF